MKQKVFNERRNNLRSRSVLALSVVLLFNMLLFSVSLSSNDVIAVSRQSSITISTSTNNLLIDMAPKADGVFNKSNASTISVTTNNYSGYTLSIVNPSAGTNAGSLINNADNSNTIPSIQSSVSESSFKSSSDYNNQWGYRPSQYVTVNSTNNENTMVENNTDFLPAPSADGDILDITTSANSSNSSYTLDFGTKVDYNTVPGSYAKSLTIVAIGNPIIYSITFSDDTGDSSVSGLPSGTGTISTSDSEILIPQDVPTRTGYNFVGWCESAPNNNGTVCESNTPYPASTSTNPSYYEINQTVDNSELKFYPTWSPKTYTITLNGNGGDSGSGSATTIATYNATTLSSITNPTKSNTTGTRTIGGFATTGTNASGATVSFQAAGNCTGANNCQSTNTTTYTFNGWHKDSGTGELIANNATTPVLQPNTAYTDANGKWNDDVAASSSVMLYAGWDSDATSYSSVTLPTITKTGYTCGWDTNQSAINYTYTSGSSMVPSGVSTTLYGICKANTYTVTLDRNGGSTGSTSTTATYGSTTLANITVPTRSSTTGTRTISGFTLPASNNADNATITYSASGCTSASNCKSTNTITYTFDGWHKDSGTGELVASSAATPVLQANTAYTDANGNWASASGQTLYAGWTANPGAYSAVTLPAITKTGHTCGWTTVATGASSITYASGSSFSPNGETTLYGVCTTNTYSLTINIAGEGVSGVQVRTGSGTSGILIGTVIYSGDFVGGLEYGQAYYLNPIFEGGYKLDNWAKNSTAGSLSSTSDTNPTFTMGDGNGAVTITGKSSLIDYCSVNGIPDEECMQKMTSTNCPTTAKTVMDSRDGKTYKIQKLSDGNCWLLDNLALDIADNDIQGNLTSQNTNADNLALDYLKGIKTRNPSVDPDGQYATSAVSTIWNNVDNPDYTTTRSYSDPRIYTGEMDTIAQGSDPMASTVQAGGWKTGIYYNYCAATAGACCYGRGTDYGNTYGAVDADICPRGWRMPTGGINGEYQALTGSTSSSITGAGYESFRNVLHLPLGGFASNGSPSAVGMSAEYWASTIYLNYYGEIAYLSTSTLNAQNTFNRYNGGSVRCIKETRTISDVIYMQDVIKAMVDNTPVGTTVVLKDRRDEAEYRVSKLEDGNLWMLDNLALDATTISLSTLKGNTNASSTSLGYLKNGGGTSSDQYATSSVSTTWDSISSSYAYDRSYSDPRIYTADKTVVPINPPTSGGGNNRVGVYYNYCAASAGSYCYGYGSSSGTSIGDATQDICPSRWRMPSGNSKGEFKALFDNANYNTVANYRNALSLPLSGYVSSGYVNGQGSYGNWWSSSRDYDSGMNYLYVTSSSVSPASNKVRSDGNSVRCLYKL